jgi:caa(3)-type oxidase subunit IV
LNPNREHLLTYLGLLGLLGLTFLAARYGWGGYAWAVGLLIAAAKIVAIARNFMEVKHSDAPVRVAAAVGIVWLAVFLALVLPDYLARNDSASPSLWPQAALRPEISKVRARAR